MRKLDDPNILEALWTLINNIGFVGSLPENYFVCYKDSIFHFSNFPIFIGAIFLIFRGSLEKNLGIL